jgi:hypothetical protein
MAASGSQHVAPSIIDEGTVTQKRFAPDEGSNNAWKELGQTLLFDPLIDV